MTNELAVALVILAEWAKQDQDRQVTLKSRDGAFGRPELVAGLYQQLPTKRVVALEYAFREIEADLFVAMARQNCEHLNAMVAHELKLAREGMPFKEGPRRR